MLSEKEVKHITHLARIELSDKELKKFQKELSRIVDFVSELNKAKVPQAAAGGQIMGLENIFQEDKVHGLVNPKGPSLLAQAPESRESFFVVPEVIDKSNK